MSYLISNPPVRSQFRRPRRERLSGLVVVHTFEAPPTPAWTVRRAAEFIRTRSDAGSYHEAVQRHEWISLVPDDAEAYHVAAHTLNRPSWGISAVCRTVDWAEGDPFTLNTLDTMARRIVAFWQRNGFDPRQARWATPAEAIGRTRGPLLTTHGDVQPGDRSDAWTRLPIRRYLDDLLLQRIRAHATPTPPPRPEDDEMFYHVRLHSSVAARNHGATEALILPGGSRSPVAHGGFVAAIPASRKVVIDLTGDPAGSEEFLRRVPEA